MEFLGLSVSRESQYDLSHRGVPIGSYRADLVVNDRVIIEVKTGLAHDRIATVQLLNYLRAADLAVGLVVQYQPGGARIKRVVASPDYRARWK